ncbi:ribonuclease HI [Aliifodinibius sp. S!AR15-10]|uniref:ribonuclease HI n=1 Tax=Aliifodinibius sp. S!AR15-10 TaxID=2950437 RepID=UPI00285CE3C9|nr:ribonuclease HI [Aliifodinibius sp. S!AR15-10]MDR8393110.1 ribonuclease HI [Aliifodinibius sp. S!AR15-10]
MSKKKKPSVLIYTDGACSGNPGPGGWAALLSWNGKEKEISGGEPDTTNNRMEMRAIIEALKALTRPCRVEIRSDSALIINAFKQNWVGSWIKRGWKKSNKKPVENQDLWKEMLKAMKPHDVTWTKVKGHADDERNNHVDGLAVEASKQYQ